MKKARTLLCLMLLMLLIPSAFRLRGILPTDTQPLIEKKYGGWAGVLRLWIFEGWQTGAGSAAGWLNQCIGSYEKLHPGVYVQPEYVDASTLRALGRDGMPPPDMVLFPPGALSSPDGLLSIEGGNSLRSGLNSSPFAVPVMLGGYLWAYNAELLDRLPSSWRNVEVAPTCFEDETWRQWRVALLALCSGRYADESEGPGAQDDLSGEMDLGLSERLVTQTPEPRREEGPLRCLLPEGFSPDSSAWQAFINGDAAAMPVTQREIRRLQALSDQGNGMDWRLGESGGTFTDQVLYLSLVDRPEVSEKLDLCQAFAAHLLSEPCQNSLYRAGAFSVTDSSSGYAVDDPLAALDALLRRSTPVYPGPFDVDWASDVETIVREFIGGSPDPAELWRQASERIAQNPNINVAN